MCGRYRIEDTDRFRNIIDELMRSPLVAVWQKIAALTTSGEVCPTDIVPVVAINRRGERAVFPMKWGFAERSLLINARVETASWKTTFREAWRSHRCAIPASCYNEWSHIRGADGKVHTGEKYCIHPEDSDITWICGLYRFEDGLPVFVILTREPGEEVSKIHDRMPLILPDEYIDDWIRPDANPDGIITAAITDMVLERADEALKI